MIYQKWERSIYENMWTFTWETVKDIFKKLDLMGEVKAPILLTFLKIKIYFLKIDNCKFTYTCWNIYQRAVDTVFAKLINFMRSDNTFICFKKDDTCTYNWIDIWVIYENMRTVLYFFNNWSKRTLQLAYLIASLVAWINNYILNQTS